MDQTSLSLLLRLRQGKSAADWNRFVELYTPVLLAWGMRAGMRQDEARDLVQDVMLTLLKKLPEFEYNPQMRFRAWLKTVLMNKWRDRMRRQGAAPTAGEEGLSGIAAESSAADDFWEKEHRQLLVRRALEMMQADFKEATWRACWMTVVEGRSVGETAQELGISENAVYIARHRVIAHLKQELAEFMDDD